jgi:hypothetical protein
MKVTTETICTDPWIFGATATVDGVEHFCVGNQDESRAMVRTRARNEMQEKLDAKNASRN